MNIDEQNVNGTSQVNLSDCLNSSLMELKIKKTSNNLMEDNKLIIYIDKNSGENVTNERKEYIYVLDKPLAYFNEVSDEFIMQLEVKNNKVSMQTFIKRMVGINESSYYLLEEPIIETLDNKRIILFSGTNYVYTNYNDSDITLTYLKDNSFNKLYLNNALYISDKESDEEIALANIYYSKCFTKEDELINLDVNNIKTNCINSKDNSFSIDESGNLTVKTITIKDPISSTKILDIYPVGSIYMNITNVDPSLLFGGIWEQIKDKFLLSCGDVYENGITGGEAAHNLTVNEMPSHTHGSKVLTGSANIRDITNVSDHNTVMSASGIMSKTLESWSGTHAALSTANLSNYKINKLSVNATHEHAVVGANESHNNMPPFLSVYVWKRVE